MAEEVLTLNGFYLLLMILAAIGSIVGYFYTRGKSEGKRDTAIKTSFESINTTVAAQNKTIETMQNLLSAHLNTSAVALAELSESRKEVADHETRLRAVEKTSTAQTGALSTLQDSYKVLDERLRTVEDRTSKVLER